MSTLNEPVSININLLVCVSSAEMIQSYHNIKSRSTTSLTGHYSTFLISPVKIIVCFTSTFFRKAMRTHSLVHHHFRQALSVCLLLWYLLDSWLVLAWQLIGTCLTVDWYLIDSWLVLAWRLIGTWLTVDWYMLGTCLADGWLCLASACCQSIDKEQQANRKRLTEMVVYMEI